LPLSHIFRVTPSNSDALETISMSGPFSKLNIYYMRYWRKQDWFEMPSR
jgi:hypothetical protein